MIVYVAVNENEEGETTVLGAFTERELAMRKTSEYAAGNPEEECWIESFDTERWQNDPEGEYRMVHRTRVSKTMDLTSHVIVFTKDEVIPVEEMEGWYVVQSMNHSFDREDGLKQNLELLKEYLAAHGHKTKLLP
ncbi:MAG: hypothetical protein IJX95_00475 [Lachnospiraceae bacterium]|nr:hypothetical protein [Lachnospiraceae bacterium]